MIACRSLVIGITGLSGQHSAFSQNRCDVIPIQVRGICISSVICELQIPHR